MNIPEFGSSLPNEPNVILDLSSTVDLATLAIAFIIAVVEIKNYLVARDGIRHELFEKRFQVYKEVHDFLSVAIVHSHVKDDSLPKFYIAMNQANFLFGKDIHRYLNEIKDHAFVWRIANTDAWDQETEAKKKSEAVKRSSDEFDWFHSEANSLHTRFGPYMNFDHKR